MNNDYDREPLVETVTLTEEAAEPVVKLVLMQGGATVIAEVVEHMYADYYTLINPKTVSLEVTREDGQDVVSSISYASWAPLSADNTFQIYKTAVVSVCTCLLYTSPSPRDVEESRMPSSA